MKTSFKTILGCLSLLFLAACDDGKENILPPEPEEEPTLEIISEIPSNVFNFTAAGNKAETLEFTTNKDWQIEVTYLDENEQPSIEAQDWVTVSIVKVKQVKVSKCMWEPLKTKDMKVVRHNLR